LHTDNQQSRDTGDSNEHTGRRTKLNIHLKTNNQDAFASLPSQRSYL
jgi:hypothetical protein